MLKVTITRRGNERTIQVEGDLMGLAVSELESAWSQVRDSSEDSRIVVDLSGTTAIDADGKKVLTVMASQGAELFAKGIYTGYLVKALVQKVNAGCRS